MTEENHFEAYKRMIAAVAENIKRKQFSSNYISHLLHDLREEVEQCLGLELFSEAQYQSLCNRLTAISDEVNEQSRILIP